MKPLDPDIESLLRQWIEMAEADLEAAEGSGTSHSGRGIVSLRRIRPRRIPEGSACPRIFGKYNHRRPPLSFSPKTLPAVESQPPRYAT
jgi:hypothetical protein